MVKAFVGGTMDFTFFEGDKLFSKATTLTDSSIDFSISEEEVRAGKVNSLIGKFFHSPKVDLKLSNACFDLNWIGGCVGATPEFSADVMKTEDVKLGASGKGKISGKAVKFYDHDVIGWARLKGADEYQTVKISEAGEFTFVGGAENDHVCIEYCYTNPNAEAIRVPANIIPSTFRGYGVANLYSADAKSSKTKIGRLIIKAERIQMNCDFSIGLSASGVAKQEVNATLLVAEDGETCDTTESGYYVDIAVEIDDAHWYDDVTTIVCQDAIEIATSETEEIVVKALHNSALPSLPPVDELTFTSSATGTATVDAKGVVKGVASGSTNIEVKITNKPDVKATVAVTVS